jgi:hypothetical protein
VTGNGETVIAWWIMLVCLLPSVLLVQKSQFLSVKVIVWIVFISLSVTMPLFYLRPDSYQFQFHRPFGFTGIESFQVFSKLGIFLLIIVSIAAIIAKFFNLPKKSAHLTPSAFAAELVSFFRVKKSQTTVIVQGDFNVTVMIALVIAIMLPINNWMFQKGIGITGVAPPQLPFHLSGILTYLSTLVVPFFLAAIYIRTSRRSLLPVVVLCIYSVFLGVSTLSRTPALFIILAPLAFSLLDRHWILFSVTVVLASFSLSLITFSREIVHGVQFGVTFANTNLGVLGTLLETVSHFEWDRFFLIIPGMIGRIVGFQELWLASQVNPEALGGGWSLWIKTLHHSMISLGHDAMHFEVRGHTVPLGFNMGLSGLLSYVFAASNDSFFYYVIFSVLALFFLITQEFAIRKIGRKYSIMQIFIDPLVFLFALKYLVSAGWPVGNYVWVFIMGFSLVPRINLFTDLAQKVGIAVR